MSQKILVLHHYYHPDDVAAARLFTDLCENLSKKSYKVEVWPSNRSCHGKAAYSLEPADLNGVLVRRVWRPPLSQHSFLGRVLNALWMLKFWWLRLAFTPSCGPDVIITGTDPLLTVILHPFLRLLRPKAEIVHWCFDLYPEAALADGIVGKNNPILMALTALVRRGYFQCGLAVDLGSCMRKRLEKYPIKKSATLTPWALEEPAKPLPIDKKERENLFGKAKLGLLYSGSFGRAHEFYMILKLARLMGSQGLFVFSARGSRLAELRLAVNPEDANIHFADPASGDQLSSRLSAPDVHLVSLRPEWNGIVVPSKFFGALAAGRPVLFEGSPDCCIARWIEEYRVGWVLTPTNPGETAKSLLKFSANKRGRSAMFKHCHKVYQAHFSKKIIMNKWEKELQTLFT